MARRIFVSYARNDLQTEELLRFLKELENELQVGFGDNSFRLFRDSADVQLGEDWSEKIENELKTAPMMLAICSPSYLSSEYCGKEFGVFDDRVRIAKRSAPGTEKIARAVFPIVWMYPESGLPANIASLQYHNDDFPASYKKHGLRQLYRLNRYEDDAREAVTVLAAALVKASKEGALAPLESIKPLKELQSVFRTHARGPDASVAGAEFNGPNLARIVVAAGKKEELEPIRTFLSSYDSKAWAWRPYTPQSDLSIGSEAQIVTGQSGLQCEFLEADDAVCAKIREAADRREIVVILADPWTLKLPAYAMRLAPLDQLYLVNCAVLIVWNNTDQETVQRAEELEGCLKTVFAAKCSYPPPGHHFKGIDTVADLRRHLERSLTEARLRIIETVPSARRANSQQLELQAQASGVDTTSRATLDGPTGGRQ